MATAEQEREFAAYLLNAYNTGELSPEQQAQVDAQRAELQKAAYTTQWDPTRDGLQVYQGDSLTSGQVVLDDGSRIYNPHGGSTYIYQGADGTQKVLSPEEAAFYGVAPSQEKIDYNGAGWENDLKLLSGTGGDPNWDANNPAPESNGSLQSLIDALNGGGAGSANPLDVSNIPGPAQNTQTPWDTNSVINGAIYGQAQQQGGLSSLNSDGYRPMRVTAAANAGQFAQPGGDPGRWLETAQGMFPEPKYINVGIPAPQPNVPSGTNLNVNGGDSPNYGVPPTGGVDPIEPLDTGLLQQYMAAKGTPG